MKKIIYLLLGLSLLSLACLQTAMVNGPVQTGTAKAAEFVTQIPSMEVSGGLDTPAATRPPEFSCAQVIASRALNVRFGASDRDLVLTWLISGEVVRVVDRSDRDWWKIERDGVIGFARSRYLQESECE